MLKNMRLFKRGEIWYVQLSRTRKKSLRTTNKAEALKAFKEIQRAAILKKLIEYDKTISLGNFIEKYLEYSEQFLAENTTRITKNAFKFLTQIIEVSTPLNMISQNDIKDFITFRLNQQVSKTTINIDLRHLKAAFGKAVEWGFIKKNTLANIKLFKIKKSNPRFLTKEDVEKVRQTIQDERWRQLFDFYVYTGARRSEVLSLEWKDITNKFVIFRTTKEGKERKVPICPQLNKTIKKMKGQRTKIGKVFYNFNDKYVSKKFTKILTEAGFKGYRLHDLRHTFASLLIMEGIDLLTVKTMLGHSDIAVTQIYTHLTTKHLENAVKKINW